MKSFNRDTRKYFAYAQIGSRNDISHNFLWKRQRMRLRGQDTRCREGLSGYDRNEPGPKDRSERGATSRCVVHTANSILRRVSLSDDDLRSPSEMTHGQLRLAFKAVPPRVSLIAESHLNPLATPNCSTSGYINIELRTNSTLT